MFPENERSLQTGQTPRLAAPVDKNTDGRLTAPADSSTKDPSADPHDGVKELILEATYENLTQVLDFLNGCLEELGCPPRTRMKLDVAVEELFINIASYAYTPDTGPATLRIWSEEAPKRVSVTFIDSGVPYDPLAKPDPDVTLAAEDREIGGLGIFMVKKSMDDMVYEYKNGQNVLTIMKILE